MLEIVFTDEELEQDKKKLESMADIMKNPTKVILLLVSVYSANTLANFTHTCMSSHKTMLKVCKILQNHTQVLDTLLMNILQDIYIKRNSQNEHQLSFV